MDQHDLIMELECESEEQKPQVNSGRANLQSLLDQTSNYLLAPTPEVNQQQALPDHDLLAWFDDHRGAASNASYCSTDHVVSTIGTSVASCSGSKFTTMAGEGKVTAGPGANGATAHLERLASDCSMIGGLKEEVRDGWEKADKRQGLGCGKSLALKRRSGEKRKSTAWGSDSAKSRLTAAHTQYERKRREKINERMKELQKLVPSSHQNDDKASLLDKTIEHIKQLQAHGQTMSNMNNNISQMLMPNMPTQQQPNNSPVMGMGMGMGSMMSMFSLNQPVQSGMAMQAVYPSLLFPTFIGYPTERNGKNLPASDHSTVAPNHLSPFMPYQTQMPMDVETLSRMAAFFQQYQNPSRPNLE